MKAAGSHTEETFINTSSTRAAAITEISWPPARRDRSNNGGSIQSPSRLYGDLYCSAARWIVSQVLSCPVSNYRAVQRRGRSRQSFFIRIWNKSSFTPPREGSQGGRPFGDWSGFYKPPN